jgi:hypothetical protein
MRLRIEYFDHNESLAALLPREVCVISTPNVPTASSLGIWQFLMIRCRERVPIWTDL